MKALSVNVGSGIAICGLIVLAACSRPAARPPAPEPAIEGARLADIEKQLKLPPDARPLDQYWRMYAPHVSAGDMGPDDSGGQIPKGEHLIVGILSPGLTDETTKTVTRGAHVAAYDELPWNQPVDSGCGIVRVVYGLDVKRWLIVRCNPKA